MTFMAWFDFRDDWSSLIEAIPGCAVRSFDSEEQAKQSYQESLDNGLVERVQVLGERRMLTEDELSGIPGLVAGELSRSLYLTRNCWLHVIGAEYLSDTQKWYSVTVGTNPGLYPAL